MTAKRFYEMWNKPRWMPDHSEAYFANWIFINGYTKEFEMAKKAMVRHLKKAA